MARHRSDATHLSPSPQMPTPQSRPPYHSRSNERGEPHSTHSYTSPPLIHTTAPPPTLLPTRQPRHPPPTVPPTLPPTRQPRHPPPLPAALSKCCLQALPLLLLFFLCLAAEQLQPANGAPPSGWLINIGGPPFTTPGGREFLPDSDPIPWYYNMIGRRDSIIQMFPGNTSISSNRTLAGERTLFYSLREGAPGSTINFVFPLGNGLYQVRIYFMEYQDSAQRRLMDVYLQGSKREAGLDVRERAYGLTFWGTSRKYLAAVRPRDSGALNLTLVPLEGGKVVISGVAISSVVDESAHIDGPPSPAPGPAAPPPPPLDFSDRYMFIPPASRNLPIPSDAATLGWYTYLNRDIGLAPMHAAQTYQDTIVFLDRTDARGRYLYFPNSTEAAYTAEIDILTGDVRPLSLTTNTFCSAGAHLADGTIFNNGGYGYVNRTDGGLRATRMFRPCPVGTNCDWEEDQTGQARNRWYPTNQILPDGSVIIVSGSFDNTPTFTFEYWPPKGDSYYPLPFLSEIEAAGLYPVVWLLPTNDLFILAGPKSIIFDYRANNFAGKVVQYLPDTPDGCGKTYYDGGGNVMLPLSWQDGFSYVDAVFCGGGKPRVNPKCQLPPAYCPACNTCVRLHDITSVRGKKPYWTEETMPGPRTMGEGLFLGNSRVVFINGASTGYQSYEAASGPVLEPWYYDPDADEGKRFTVWSTGTVARGYHATALLDSMGRVIVGGSNPRVSYFPGNFSEPKPPTYIPDFPTETSTEAFLPPYLFAPVRPRILVVHNSSAFSKLYRSRRRVLQEPSSGTPFPLFINAGCSAMSCPSASDAYQTSWLQDDGFYIGGQILALPDSTVATGATPGSEFLFQKLRVGESEWSLPVPGAGEYNLTLYFMEPTFNSPGQRIFSVAVDGREVESALDIVQRTGGPNRVLSLSYRTVVPAGSLLVGVSLRDEQMDEPIIAALSLGPWNGPQPPPGSPQTFVRNINCGGGNFTDNTGEVWEGDDSVVTPYMGSIARESPEMLVADPLGRTPMFSTARQYDGELSYSITVPAGGGGVTIVLFFSVFDFTGEGMDTFNIRVQNSLMSAAFDPSLSCGGYLRSCNLTFQLEPMDAYSINTVSLLLTPIRGSAIISGISIFGYLPTAATPAPSPTAPPPPPAAATPPAAAATPPPAAAAPTAEPEQGSPVAPVLPAAAPPVPVPSYVLAINSGSGQSFTDETGLEWLADRYFNAGYPQAGVVDNVVDGLEPMLSTYRWGEFMYALPAPYAGTYAITLYFAETVFSGPGLRQFGLQASDSPTAPPSARTTLLNSWDLYLGTGAPHRFVTRTFRVPVNQTVGTIFLFFVRQSYPSSPFADFPEVHGIRMVLETPAPAPVAPPVPLMPPPLAPLNPPPASAAWPPRSPPSSQDSGISTGAWLSYGQEFVVDFEFSEGYGSVSELYPDPEDVEVNLVSTTFSTHALSMNLRSLKLQVLLLSPIVSATGTPAIRALVQAPPSTVVAPAGYYMLWVVWSPSSVDVPIPVTKAAWVRLLSS